MLLQKLVILYGSLTFFVLQQRQNLGRRLGTSKLRLSPTVALAAVRSKAAVCSVVFDSVLIVTPNVGFCNCSMFCYAILCVYSSFAIILMGKRELVALLCLSSWCLAVIVWLFLTMPRACQQFVILVFPDHTHLLFLIVKYNICLKTLLQQDISELLFYDDLVYKFKRMVGKPNFCDQLKPLLKVIFRWDITWISCDSPHVWL